MTIDPPPAGRIRAYIRTLTTGGLAGAALFASMSLTPSLLPRSWVVQGVLTGLCALSGYGIGTFLGWAAKTFDFRGLLTARVRRTLRWVLLAATAVSIALTLYLAVGWQQESRAALGVAPLSAGGAWGVIIVPVLAVIVTVPVLGLFRWLTRLTRTLTRFLARVIPVQVAKVVAVVVVSGLTWGIFSGVIWDGVLRGLNASFAAATASFDPGLEAPTLAERSGSPHSSESWESLGREGRRFVTGGPTAADISAFTATLPSAAALAPSVPALAPEPIRVYSGLDGGPEATAAAVVAELDRTDAWSRKDLLVVSSTGTGWVDRSMVDSFELMHGGDTAIAAMQYSNLPSWLSFIGDRVQPAIGSEALFDAVYDRWAQEPAATRPRLYVAGLSLGSYGMQSVFSGPQDLSLRTDGALFVGTPNFTGLWREVTAARDAGTPEVAPIYRQGSQLRFLTSAFGPSEVSPADTSTWAPPRTVFAQHGSDGVVWWSPDLIWSKPDWLRETRANDVASSSIWFPVVTFWQVTADLFFAGASDVPSGAGHHYGAEYSAGFADISAPDGWTDADTAVLQEAISAYSYRAAAPAGK